MGAFSEIAVGDQVHGRESDGSVLAGRVCGLVADRGQIFAILLRTFLRSLVGEDVFSDIGLQHSVAGQVGTSGISARFINSPYVAVALSPTTLVNEAIDHAVALGSALVGARADVEGERISGLISSTRSKVSIDARLVEGVGVLRLEGGQLSQPSEASRLLGRRLLSNAQVVGTVIAVGQDRLFFYSPPGSGWDAENEASDWQLHGEIATAGDIGEWNRSLRRAHFRAFIVDVPSLLSVMSGSSSGAEEALGGLIANARRRGAENELIKSLQDSGLLIDLNGDQLFRPPSTNSGKGEGAILPLADYARMLMEVEYHAVNGGEL